MIVVAGRSFRRALLPRSSNLSPERDGPTAHVRVIVTVFARDDPPGPLAITVMTFLPFFSLALKFQLEEPFAPLKAPLFPTRYVTELVSPEDVPRIVNDEADVLVLRVCIVSVGGVTGTKRTIHGDRLPIEIPGGRNPR